MKTVTEWIDFADVQVGDTLRFLTANNGFGGDGRSLSCTAKVIKITAKTVVMDSGLRGKTAVLRASDWYGRDPHKVAEVAEKTYEQQYYDLIDRLDKASEGRWTTAKHRLADLADNALDTANEGSVTENSEEFFRMIVAPFEDVEYALTEEFGDQALSTYEEMSW